MKEIERNCQFSITNIKKQKQKYRFDGLRHNFLALQ